MGVALHDLELEEARAGEKSWKKVSKEMTGIWGKARRQIVKDYVAFRLLSGPAAPFIFAANFTANMVRNVWAHSIIFCGHFPDQTYTFSEDEFEDESEGASYVRHSSGRPTSTEARSST